jgi:hypothetical protein
MVVDQVPQHFPAGFGTIVRSTDYYYALGFNQLLCYHITCSFSVNKHAFLQQRGDSALAAKVRKEMEKKKMIYSTKR